MLVNDRVGRPNGSGVPVFTLGTPGQRYSSVSVRGRLASDKQILVIIILILHSLYPFTFCSDNPAKLFTIRTFFPSAGIANVNPLLFSLLSLFLGGTLINGLGCRVCGRIHAECYNWPRLVSCMRLLLKVQIPDFWTEWSHEYECVSSRLRRHDHMRLGKNEAMRSGSTR